MTTGKEVLRASNFELRALHPSPVVARDPPHFGFGFGSVLESQGNGTSCDEPCTTLSPVWRHQPVQEDIVKSLTKAQLASELAAAKARISELETQLAAQRTPSTPPAQLSEEFTDRSSALAKLKMLCMNGQRAVLRGNKLILL